MTRENTLLESCKALMSQKERCETKRLAKLMEQVNARQALKDNYYRLAEAREAERAEHEQFMEAARDDAFSTALKAIYLTAIEAATLTDQGIVLAENMVDTWIAENGGATKILGKAQNKSYFLARLTQIVEDAAIAAVAEAEDDSDPADEEEEDKKEEEKKEESEEDKDNQPKDDAEEKEGEDDAEAEEKADSSEDKSDEEKEEESSDSDKSEESGDDDSTDEGDEENTEEEQEDGEGSDTTDTAEDQEDNADSDNSGDETTEEIEDYSEELDELNDDEVDSDEDASEDDDVEDIVGDPLDDDGMDSDDTVDGNEDKGQLMNDLESEPDVQKAVELIRTRVADAEETFIKNNARDKKEIDELVNRLSDSIKTVEAIKDKDSREAKVAQEHVDMIRRDMDKIHEGYLTDIFSNMARALNKGIMKHEAVFENYKTEDGKIDTDLVVETTKIMYGFMETLRTLKLAKVDEAYIENVLRDMEK